MPSLGAVYAALYAAYDATVLDINKMQEKAAGAQKDPLDEAQKKQIFAQQQMLLLQAASDLEKKLMEVTSNKMKSEGDVAMTLARNVGG